MKLILQPEGSSQCGQTCVAMAASVSLERSIEAVGRSGATHTADIVRGLRALGVSCADRLVRISRKRPNLPRRAIVVILRPAVMYERRAQSHWMLTWDGKIYDPGGRWPDGYDKWRMTSYLEIL